MRLIPLPLRVLAGLVAAAALLGIVLALKAPPPVAGWAGPLAAGARGVLFLGVAVLFGYAAATGLPPAHWWRSAAVPVWSGDRLVLPPDLHRYLELLRERHPGLRECWLLAPAAPGEQRLLALAPPAIVTAVRADWDIRRPDVRLYLADDASHTVAPAWGRSTAAPFSAWDWEVQREGVAEFRCPASGEIRTARRLWIA